MLAMTNVCVIQVFFNTSLNNLFHDFTGTGLGVFVDGQCKLVRDQDLCLFLSSEDKENSQVKASTGPR